MAKQTFTTGQVLTAAQMTSLQQTAMLGGAASAKTASYTLVAADAGTAITMSNASATTITVNTALFAAGDTVQITNLGAGVCTITAGTATVNTSASLALAQYESGTLDFTSTSAAIFIKGAGAAAASGGMTLLSTTSLSSSSTTISGISGNYTDLAIIINSISNATETKYTLRINNTANFAGAGADSDAIRSYNGNVPISGTSYNSSSGTFPNSACVIIKNYASSSLYKPVNVFFGGNFSGYGPGGGVIGGHWRDTTAVSSVVIVASTGTFTAGSVQIWGVK